MQAGVHASGSHGNTTGHRCPVPRPPLHPRPYQGHRSLARREAAAVVSLHEEGHSASPNFVRSAQEDGVMLSLSFVHRRAIYTIANRRDVHSIPRGYVTVSPFEAHIALADRFRRDLDVVQHFLRSVPGGPHDVRSDLQVREFFKTAFDEPQGELVCFKREIVLPPPPTCACQSSTPEIEA